MLTTKATIAASRITGSANMKIGIVPEVRVTNAEQRVHEEWLDGVSFPEAGMEILRAQLNKVD